MVKLRTYTASLLLLACVCLSGCAQTETTPDLTAESNVKEEAAAHGETFVEGEKTLPETIYGFDIADSTIKFKVKSTGCTKAADFALVLDTVDGQDIITIVRNRQDWCRALPRLYPVELPLPESLADTATVRVANPVGLESDFDGKGKPKRQNTR